MGSDKSSETGNLLLRSLPAEDRERLNRVLRPMQFRIRETMFSPGRPIEAVQFPNSGVISVVNEVEPGQLVEYATIGLEGFVGLPLLLGDDRAISTAFVQVAGEGLVLAADDFRRAVDEMPALRTLLMKYTLALFAQVSQTATCNRVHEVQERCARWLLQTHDRVPGDRFLLTQEFLGQMLGVHRPTVSVAAAMLQKAGLISYVRGQITIIDRPGLEAASCRCYAHIQREYERLLGSDAEADRPPRQKRASNEP